MLLSGSNTQIYDLQVEDNSKSYTKLNQMNEAKNLQAVLSAISTVRKPPIIPGQLSRMQALIEPKQTLIANDKELRAMKQVATTSIRQKNNYLTTTNATTS